MKNILLKIEYDGTGFSGWQRQPEARTVQGEIESVLTQLCRMPVTIDGTGRTDAGVHALGQCATFSGEFGIPVDRLMGAANDILAESRLKAGDVRIVSVQEVDPDFHARFSAVGKTYVYRIFNSEDMPVFLRNYRYNVKKPLDFEAMVRAGEAFVGRQDFEAFMAQGSTPQETTVRTIFGLNVEKEGNDIAISVTGDGFLYNMVRIIAGTLIDVGLGKIAAEDVAGIIASCDRKNAGHTAPPQGLFMAQVYFDEADMLAGASVSRMREK